MTDLSNIQTSGAIYTPSISRSYAKYAIENSSNFRNGNLPGGIAMSDLNFLDPKSKLFHISHVLYSAGQAMGKKGTCMIQTRDRKCTKVIGDSGGYQFITGNLVWEGDRTRARVLDWLETYCDISMTLDIPTACIGNPKSQFQTFDVCLDTTLENLRYFKQNRKGSTKFLNVLQGRNHSEAMRWYNAVKEYRFDGFAFGGHTRVDLASVLRRLIRLRDDKLLEKESWLHFLGIGTLSMSCLLTTLQTELRKTGLDELKISYDTSSPFLMAGKYQRGFTFPKYDKNGFAMSSAEMPIDRANVGSETDFPFLSAIGKRLTIGDICVRNKQSRGNTWDDLSWMMIANHNLECLLRSIDQAQKLIDLETIDAQKWCPLELLNAQKAIRTVLRSETPFDDITKNARKLKCLVNGKASELNDLAIPGEDNR